MNFSLMLLCGGRSADCDGAARVILYAVRAIGGRENDGVGGAEVENGERNNNKNIKKQAKNVEEKKFYQQDQEQVQEEEEEAEEEEKHHPLAALLPIADLERIMAFLVRAEHHASSLRATVSTSPTTTPSTNTTQQNANVAQSQLQHLEESKASFTQVSISHGSASLCALSQLLNILRRHVQVAKIRWESGTENSLFQTKIDMTLFYLFSPFHFYKILLTDRFPFSLSLFLSLYLSICLYIYTYLEHNCDFILF
tara:strand:+ start:577 stop:1338 length:762 start_codon:yes stop_codon:yes gene_type:complete